MKKCPFCAEEIQDGAIKCKHCGEILIEVNQDKEKYQKLKGIENRWAMWCHLIAFSDLIIPFGAILGPLIIWIIKKDEFPLVNDQGKESLNFQISILIYVILSFILCIILIGFILLIVLLIFWIIQVIQASINASNGKRYRYPFCIRFIK